MAHHHTAAARNAQMTQLGAVVTRCGCGDPDSHSQLGLPCPRPRATEGLGTVAYWHKSPWKRARFRVRKWIAERLGRGQYV